MNEIGVGIQLKTIKNLHMESETIRFSPPPRVVGTILHTAPHFGQLFTQNTQKSGKNL